MAKKPKVYELDWSSFDKKSSDFAYKQQNDDLLASGDPLWLKIFESQPPHIRERIARGEVSLKQLEANRAAVSDTPSSNVPDILIENPELTPEEAGVVAETAPPINSRLDALGAHFSGTRDVMGANAEFQDLDSLRELETPEARAKKKAELEAALKSPEVNTDISGARRMGIMAGLARVAEAERIFTTPGEFDRILQEIGSKRILGGQEAGRAEEYYERTGNKGTRTVGDIVSQPESAGSVIGGVAGSVLGPVGAAVGAMAGAVPITKQAYDAAYTEARLAGVDQKQAEVFATAMMGSEYFLEAVGGKATSGLKGILQNELRRFAPEIAGKTLTKAGVAAGVGGLVGYGEEAGTTAIQDVGALAASVGVDDPAFKKFLEERPVRAKDGSIDVWATLANWNRAGLSGAGQGGIITGAGAAVENKVQQVRKEQEAILANTVGNEAARARYAAMLDAATKKAEELTAMAEGKPLPVEDALKANTDLFGEPPALPPSNAAQNTNPLNVISDQYSGTGGRLTDGVSMPDINTAPQKPVPLTPEQRNAELKKKIEAMGTIPATPVAPVKPRTKGSKPFTPAGKSKLPLVEKPAPKAKQEPSEPLSQDQLLKKIEGLKSERAPGKLVTPGQKSKNIISYLARTGTADSDSMLELINKGKLGIVDREADLPDGLEKGRDGWYDPVAKRVYLVAENLSKDTVRGTALHEINHFLNRNKKDGTTKTGINKLISGNVDIYNNRIKNLAKSGNKIAQRALQRATEDGNITEELTSYFASEALDVIQKQGILGTARQVYKDIKSAINTTARDKGIGELTDNDISYILRRQVEDAPSVDFTDGDAGLADGRASIIGTKSPKFGPTAAKYPERVYRGARDNKFRVEISDRKAQIKDLSRIKRQISEEPESPVYLSDIIDHKELFDAYPGTANQASLADMKVLVDPGAENNSASYDSNTDTIEVNPYAFNDPVQLKKLLLHELQHAIQKREDFESGASLKAMTDEIRQSNPGISDKELGEKAWRRYQRAYGEAEARLSEDNFQLTDEELSDQLPEQRMTELEWNVKEQRVDRKRIHPLQTGPGNRLVQRADRRGVDLPKGLASIKPARGGEFAPAFVDGLFKDFVNGRNGISAIPKERQGHFARMLKNYLNRWAGLSNDPLKDVDSPLLGGYTWEEAWDNALTPASKAAILDAAEKTNLYEDYYYNLLPDNRVPNDATIWGGQFIIDVLSENDDADAADANYKLGEFLSHVGERLAHVPLDELSKTDLIRAVRETVAADEIARKKAEKQKAVQDSKLKTYIQFPDGYRWVRLDSPGQFAAESDMMGHSVRGYEPSGPYIMRDWFDIILEDNEAAELKQRWNNRPKTRNDTSFYDWLQNTPEYQAYVQENILPEGAGEGGHPHYGYGGWDAIKKDNARIYSLRDPKGKSVVTVELGKEPDYSATEDTFPATPKDKFEVSQIKGRYNEAPDPSLHPKIQDLLLNLNEENLLDTSGDIYDSENAGLVHDNILGGNSYHAATSPIGKMIVDFDKERMERYDLGIEDGVPITSTMMRKYDAYRAKGSFFDQGPTTRRVPSGLASKARTSSSSVGVWDDTTMSIVKLLFDPNKGIGKQGLETKDYWRLKSAGYRDLAEGVAVRLNNQLKKQGIDREEFKKAVNKAEKQKTPEERDRALDALVRNYGEAAIEYRDGRMMIDNLSKQIVKDWAEEMRKTGRKAGKEELNRYAAILENIGEYSTRMYLSNIPEIGKDYAKGILRQFDKGDESSPYYNVVKEAREFLLEHEVGIPSLEEMLRRKTETIRRTYQTWIGPGDKLSKNEMIMELEQKRSEIGEDEMDRMVTKVIREMLGLDNPDEVSPVAKYYRAGALDESILKARQNVPKPLRRLLGEVTDPGQRVLITVSAQADLLYKNRMLNDFYDNGEGKFWIRPGDRAKAGNEKFTEKLPNNGYGPLDGMYVTKPFAYAIKAQRMQVVDLKQSLELAGIDPGAPLRWGGDAALRTIGGLSMAQKMSKTALDQGAWALNAVGSPLALLKNGQIITATKASREALVDAVTLAIQAGGVEHKLNKDTNARLAVLLEHGIPDSVFTAELRDVEKEFYQRLLNELNKDVTADPRVVFNAVKKGMRGGRKALRGVRDIYGLLDSWVKIADFYGQQQYLSNYYKANGETKTQEQINREAADIVKFRNITYSRSPLGVQILEKVGATVFATFASEVIRTMVTTPWTVKMALEKAKNATTAEARNVALGEATKVGLGYLTAVTLIPALSHALINTMWPDEDEEDRDRFLKLWFPQDRDQSFVVAGKNENGGVVMFNAARADPHGHVTDFIRQIAQSDTPEEFWENTKALFTSPLGNGYMADLANLVQAKGPKDSALADMAPDAQKELGDLFEELDGSRAQADRLTRLLDNFLPGGARVLDTSKTRVTGTNSDALVTNALAATGMRMTVVDPKKIAAFEAMAYNNARAQAVMRWNDLMGREGIEKEDIIRTALNIYADEQEANRRLIEVYSGLGSKLADVNPRKLLAELKVNPEDINDAALGRFRSVVLSNARLREGENRQLGQAKTPEDKRRIRENYRLAREALREIELTTR